ncbi:putative bifunctional diguanylate cyclase/phosphodiesterase [Pseudidiomarina sp. E22-M8]|uniref:putative bifunctional diguanylate cyclase/phosphodiesterase n=1 Tax=Pseudidiomarina sp. E22-M8 TaxID=3424768 RepID=UPI00403CE2C3
MNDSLGYQSGDQALIHCANCLTKLSKANDGLARLGKDEFTLLLPNLGNDMAKAVTRAEQFAQCVLDEIHRPLILNNKTHKLNARIGITLFDRNDNTDGNIILSQADIALKSAKQQADTSISFFDKQMEISLHQRLHLSQALHNVIGKGQLQLAYQPQVNRNQQLLSCEALLRWQHPEYGAISPSDFIPIAEANGSMVEIGDWVLQTCSEKLVEWSKRPQFEHLSLSINVSSIQFRQVDFVERVQDIVARTGANPKKMRFELNESLMANDIEFIIEQMHKLRQLGISLSLDDFGTGYASLAYLTQLPLDELKIDRAFVNDLKTQSKGALLAETIISLGRSMNLAVIAEGVETQAQFERLQELGCEVFQGYLFGRPTRNFDV